MTVTERKMEMGNVYNYQRISTKEERGKQKFDRQEKSIEAYGKMQGVEYLLSFKDDATGSTFKRPQWQKLEKLVQQGDTIVFKDISRFTRQAEAGYTKYMELMSKGVSLVFIDNPTISTDYIKNMMNVAEQQDLVAKTALESTIKLLLIVELDRVQKEREIFVQRVKDGIKASPKKSGRKHNQLDKMTEELEADIKEFLKDRSIKQVDLMKKHGISRNTLKKYVEIVKGQ